MRKALLASLALCLFAVGCGGSGNGSTFGGNAPLVGTFSTNFTRGTTANTSLVIFVDNKGRVGAQINDATETEWAGQGSVSGRNVTINLVPVSNGVTGNELLQGVLTSNNPPAIDITLTGAFSASATATQLTGVGVSPAQGTYSITYTGSESDTASINVTSNGNVSGTLNSPSLGNNIPLEGTLGLDGTVSFSFQITGATGSFTGFLFLPPNATLFHGSGDWTSGSMQGTWSGQKLATP